MGHGLTAAEGGLVGMSDFQLNHLNREHLVEPFLTGLAQASCGVVEGGPGYGKTSLLQLIDRSWRHESWWWSNPTPQAHDHFRGSPRDVLCDVLRHRRPVLILIDDGHRLCSSDADQVRELIERLPRRHRVVVATRGDGVLTEVLDQVRGPRIGPGRLLLSMSETAQALGLDSTASDRAHAAAIWADSCGWPEGIGEIARILAAEARDRAVGDRVPSAAEFVADRAAGLAPPVALTLGLALALPRMSLPALGALPGGRSLPQAIMDARLPLMRTLDGSWMFPAQLTALLERHPLPNGLALAAAEACLAEGRDAEAYTLLGQAGDHARAMKLLDEMPAGEAESLIEENWLLGDPESDDGSMQVALRLLRHAELAGNAAATARFRERLAVEASDPVAHAEVIAAQRARDQLIEGNTAAARLAAASLLANARSDEVRARCLDILGRVGRRRGGRAYLELAQPLLREAMALWRRLEEPGRAAESRLTLAWIDLELGDFRRALERATVVAAELPDGMVLSAHAALLRGEALTELGRGVQAERLLARVQISHLAGPGTLDARLSLGTARAALSVGRGQAARDALKTAGDPTTWPLDACGARMRAQSVELWLQLRDDTRARRAALQLDAVTGDPLPEVRAARAALAARHGDPYVALAEVGSLEAAQAVSPRIAWRVHLGAGLAALRLNDLDQAAIRVARALEAAGAIGQAQAPFQQETELVRQLLDRLPGPRERVR